MVSNLRANSPVFCLHNLPGHSMDIVIILSAVYGEFQFKNRGSVIVIEFLVVEHCALDFDIRLGKRNFLCLLQSDVGGWLSVFGISRVVVIVVNGYDV